MFLDRPDLASRYPSQLIQDLHDDVFSKSNREEIFYAAAFTLYRLKSLLGNRKLDSILNRLKWYALMALRYQLLGKDAALPTSSKVERDCVQIIEFAAKGDDDAIAVWNAIGEKFKSLGEVSRDRMRTARFVAEIKELMLA
jgi:hypothetical protein